MSYRFRTGENGELVLQVSECEENRYAYNNRIVKWRDATVADIPVNDPFVAEPTPDCLGGLPEKGWCRND